MDEYDSFDTLADPAAVARARRALLQRWLAEDSAGLFAELRERRPILDAPGTVVVTRYHDVVEVLGRHQAFSVRLYAPKMDRVAGPFILGLDDTAQYEIDASILRLAFRRDDASQIKGIVARLTQELLEDARSTGRLEVVEQVAHVVPARLVGEYFGVPGPDLTTVQRWARTMFFDIFANLRDDPAAREEALTSGAQMRAYLEELIASRRAALEASGTEQGGSDVLTRLVRMQVNPEASFDDVAIRNNLIGMIVGAIDTNSKAIVHVIDELLRRPAELEAARQAALADDDDLLSKYVFEALRFKPQNSFLVRFCEQPYTIAEGTERATAVIPPTLVFAANSSAMMDASVVDEPDTFMLDRPSFDYLHFGSGLHTCAGRFISRAQILEVAKQILRLPGLRRAEGQDGQVEYDRLFPRRFVVEFDNT
ncbi:MAG: cytochrome P450 [Egibacteraceae bacterium]